VRGRRGETKRKEGKERKENVKDSGGEREETKEGDRNRERKR